MNELKFEVKVTAMGEVRDKDGNLLSSTPIEETVVMTESELRAAGLQVPEKETGS